jgi:ribonuclease HII
MRRAFADLLSDGLPPPLRAIVDGNKEPGISVPTAARPKADALYPPVMAASILAKTARDADMRRWSWIYRGYGYEIHKGYPTAAHRAAIMRLGPSPIQRMSFRHEGRR